LTNFKPKNSFEMAQGALTRKIQLTANMTEPIARKTILVELFGLVSLAIFACLNIVYPLI
jgi:hypothetical protein